MFDELIDYAPLLSVLNTSREGTIYLYDPKLKQYVFKLDIPDTVLNRPLYEMFWDLFPDNDSAWYSAFNGYRVESVISDIRNAKAEVERRIMAFAIPDQITIETRIKAMTLRNVHVLLTVLCNLADVSPGHCVYEYKVR